MVGPRVLVVAAVIVIVTGIDMRRETSSLNVSPGAWAYPFYPFYPYNNKYLIV